MSTSPHIIVVDDEAPAREMVGDYLKMHGFAVTLCDGGKSLRTEIENRVPDLVVLDLNMPEEDGLSIIRDLKSRTNVPVIMLTATASPIDRVVGREHDAADAPVGDAKRQRQPNGAAADDRDRAGRGIASVTQRWQPRLVMGVGEFADLVFALHSRRRDRLHPTER